MTFSQVLRLVAICTLCFVFCSANDTTTKLSNLQVSTSPPMHLSDQNPHFIEPRMIPKRADGSIECTGEGCKPKQKSPKRVSKRSNSSSSSEEKRKSKKKKCKHCEGRKRRMVAFENETETENQQNTRLQGHITNNPDMKKQERIRVDRSASKSKSKSKEDDDEEYSDEDKEDDEEDDDDLYSDEKPKKKKKVVKKPPPKTSKLQDLFTHFNG